ncbi:MAG: type II toxin-antitoxin system Phd/YefM family antitoxin [Terracidiphilus sp.]
MKAKLSAHIQYVKNGEEVLILDRNKPVAKLVSVGPADDSDARLQRLIAKGSVTPPIKPRKEGEVWPAGPNIVPREITDQIWREERDRR